MQGNSIYISPLNRIGSPTKVFLIEYLALQDSRGLPISLDNLHQLRSREEEGVDAEVCVRFSLCDWKCPLSPLGRFCAYT